MRAIVDNWPVLLREGVADYLKRFLPSTLVELFMTVLVIALLLTFSAVTVMFLVWLERKVIGRIQDRYGPNRAGRFGSLQLIADTIKLLSKEDIVPAQGDRWVFYLAPIVVVVPALLIYAVIPFGRGMILTDLNVGILYVMAVSSLTTVGILMAGWSSNNKYSLLGAMRAAAQIVSYEIPMVLSVLGVILLTGSLSMVAIVNAQSRLPFVVLQPLGFLLFFVAAIAEANRTPFDLVEAESEIVAGYHTEYSGMRFALFFLAEYMNAFAISALAATLFLGGWQWGILPPYVWFFLKTYALVFVLLWIRGTLPRLRVDQLMGLAWKVMIPLALVNVFASAAGISVWQRVFGGV